MSTDVAPLFSILNSAPVPKSGLRLIISVFTISDVNSGVFINVMIWVAEL